VCVCVCVCVCVFLCVSLCMCVCIGARETSRQRATCRGKCSRNRWFLLNRFQLFFKLGMVRNDLDAWLSTLHGRIMKPRAPGPGHVRGHHTPSCHTQES